MKNFLIALFLLSALNTSAQTDTSHLIKNIRVAMDGMQHSFLKSDWNGFVNYMHPDLIKLAGGKEKLTQGIKSQMSSMGNGTIDTIGSGNVLQIVNHKGQWQCIVESFLQMTIDSRTVTVISGNIGVSDDGQSWKFIRVSTGKEGNIVQMFPSLSPQLRPPYNKTFLKNVREALKTYTPSYPEGSAD